jgi:hypothetical protein
MLFATRHLMCVEKPLAVHFHPLGLGLEGATKPPCQFPAACDGAEMKTMDQIVNELGHKGRRIDLFKIDCEGCEYTTHESWFPKGVYLQQLLVEVHAHIPPFKETMQATPMPMTESFMRNLEKRGYVIFHKESNTIGCSGACIEFSFLKLHSTFHVEESDDERE